MEKSYCLSSEPKQVSGNVTLTIAVKAAKVHRNFKEQ